MDDEADDLALPFEHGEVRGYADKFVVVSGKDKVKNVGYYAQGCGGVLSPAVACTNGCTG